ncbi:MAG: cyclic nucleotide-binding domain-containing protein [Deltaproteobacteria bacterium]|nr:cyclic nucleotide-binding domain-containing protein [Deltaproteobacteria bacterium]
MDNALGEVEGVELLQKLRIFSQLNFDETTRLGEIAAHRDVPAGEVVIERGALGDALYVIIEGEVLVTRGEDTDGDGDDEELGRLGPGQIFGEMALVDDMLTSARVRVTRDARLLVMERDAFEKVLAADDTLARKIYRGFCQTLAERLRKTNDELTAAKAFELGMR